MATFVVVHGAFGGGWEWTPVARALRAWGHDVFTPTLRISGAVDRLPRAFVRCTRGLDVGGDPIAPMAARAAAAGWTYRELDAPHDPHLFDPEATAVALHELAAADA